MGYGAEAVDVFPYCFVSPSRALGDERRSRESDGAQPAEFRGPILNRTGHVGSFRSIVGEGSRGRELIQGHFDFTLWLGLRLLPQRSGKRRLIPTRKPQLGDGPLWVTT